MTLVPMSTRNWLRRCVAGQVDRLVQEHRVVAEVAAVEVLVDHHHVVNVRLELEGDVLREQADVDLVIHRAELLDDVLLVLGLVDADERGQVARLEDVESASRTPACMWLMGRDEGSWMKDESRG